ncbi:MAG: DUF4058 family protein [Planctomycetota bacterium]|nr:DUF4058 family protein [Planctomycetota bacterium]
MPIHDWSIVNAGTFHHFHTAWTMSLSDALNADLLPEGYYAMAEQHAGRVIADVLTLQINDPTPVPFSGGGGAVALAEAPPKVSRKLVAPPEAAYRLARKTLTIRHVSDHKVVALMEIVSPANKDRLSSVEDFTEKAWAALKVGVHLLIIDLFRPGKHDPGGMHNMIWRNFDPADYEPTDGKPLTAAAYAAFSLPEAYIEPLAVGDRLPEMPLFIDRDWYANVPLEETYNTAWQAVPAYWRSVIEQI